MSSDCKEQNGRDGRDGSHPEAGNRGIYDEQKMILYSELRTQP